MKKRYVLTNFCRPNYFYIFERSSLRKKSSYSELFWSAFSYIRTEYREIRSISPYSVQMRENADQNSSEYGPILRSGSLQKERGFSKFSSQNPFYNKFIISKSYKSVLSKGLPPNFVSNIEWF